jgi:hypothetical protein
MVKAEGDPGLIPDLIASHFIEGIYGLQVQVVDLGEIHLGIDNLTGSYRFPPGILSQNFFNCVHPVHSPFFILNIVYNIRA